MKVKKQDYFGLLEDDIIYRTHKEQIDTFIREEQEIKEKKDELSLGLGRREYVSCPKEIEISDSEYEALKQHSEWLHTYEGPQDFIALSFESYRDVYEKMKEKNNKLIRVIEGLMGSSVTDTEDKVNVLLEILL